MNVADLLAHAQSILRAIFLTLPNVALGLVVFAAFALMAWLASRAVRAVLARTGQPAGLQVVLARLTTWIVLAVGLLIAVTLVFPTLNAASVFSALGITSVAIGFAFKDVLQNLLAGILILLTHPFRIGDQIISGDHEGTVEDILIRATLLKTYDGRRVVIPNSELYTGRVTVNTAFDQRRLTAPVGIGNDEDIDHASRVILDALSSLEEVLPEPPPEVVVSALGDSAVLLDVRFWVAPPSKREAVVATGLVLRTVRTALDTAGVTMPYPTQQILLEPMTDPRQDANRQ